MLPFIPSRPSDAAGLGSAAIFAQDAGSLNHIRRWMPHWPRCTLLVEVPGTTSKRALDQRQQVVTRIEASDWVLVGTGHGTLALEAMRIGSDLNRPVLAVVDHWVNYAYRFQGLRSCELPDAVIVTDVHAHRLVREQLSWATPLLWPNDMLTDLRRRVSSLGLQSRLQTSLLLLGEPVNGALNDAVAQPEAFLIEGLDALLHRLDLTTSTCDVVLRPHPSEDPAKYMKVLATAGTRARVRISLPDERDIAQDLAEADVALGITTYALYLMWASGKPAFSIAESAGYPAPFPPGTVPQLRLSP
jgi:hypothetical protein